MEEFLKDITPFFHKMHITYVDVGSCVGGTYEALRKSDIFIYEAHLIEPNPESFSKLEASVTQDGGREQITLYNFAIGAEEGSARMRAAMDLTKVIAASHNHVRTFEPGIFEVPVVSLDTLSESFRRQHISLLKVDVEGFELEVLNGAINLLKKEAVDVIYIEAGIDPENTNQTHYRKIEDLLGTFGYRMFRIYEQKNEWIDDNPLLRRVNVAFMSRRFSSANPYRLTKELFKAALVNKTRESENRKLVQRIKKAEQRRSELENDLREAVDALAKANNQIACLSDRYQSIICSTSWQVTRPLRGISRRVKQTLTGRLVVPPFRPKMTKSSKGGNKRSKTDKARKERAEVSAGVERVLRNAYERLPERAKAATPHRLKHFAKKVITKSDRIEKLDSKLWGGFSESAAIDLRACVDDIGLSARERADACYSIARWHAVQGDFSSALRSMSVARQIDSSAGKNKHHMMLEALFLCKVGEAKKAQRVIQEYQKGKAFDSSVELMLANASNPNCGAQSPFGSEEEVLRRVNAIYNHYGVAEIEKRDRFAPLSIDNLRGKNVKKHFDALNKVSVVVPVFNSADHIRTTLEGLSQQSWENLEVIIVDDASRDDTQGVVAEFINGDSRFKLICQTENRGGYAARNVGLGAASGKFITIHDSDDWSHPQKLQLQVEAALRSGVYNFSSWVRVTPELIFVGPSRFGAHFVGLNHSSGLFELENVRRLGGWDEIRVAADTTFIWRYERWLGNEPDMFRKRRILKECPLAFGRLVGSSLTRSSTTHILTTLHGIRREYLESSQYWARHQEMLPPIRGDYSRVNVPGVIRSKIEERLDIDVLFIGDFNLVGGAFHSALNMIKAARRTGLRAGLLHYRRYDLDVTKPIADRVREFAYEEGVRIVAPGETVETDRVVVTYPAIFEHPMDRFPQIKLNRLVVIVNQMAERDVNGLDKAYAPERVRKHLTRFFGTEGDWVPISNWVRTIMEDDARYPRPHHDTWTPLIDLEKWGANPAPWRGHERKHPTLGRHGRDHYLKWPSDADALLNAYCAYRNCEVKFLGGANHVVERLGKVPSNWFIKPFGSEDVHSFLSGLDFFLHYPHEQYIEEFGRAPMEAMAAGVPVILPRVFEQTFGKAALYADPIDVFPLVEKLWKSEKLWSERAQVGMEFVQKNCTYELFRSRY